MKKISTLILFTCLGFSIFGQQVKVRILDSKTGEPVPFAHVCFESLNDEGKIHSVSSGEGFAEVDMKGKIKLAVSFVGYETLFDTLVPGGSTDVFLKPKVFNMGEVVVTAQYTPQAVDKSIYKIKVIGIDEITQKGATNLAEILTHELSIRVGQNGIFGSNMNIRGLGGQHVKYLVDGIPVIGRLNGEIDLGDLAVNNVDHIEVIEGPMSVVYGSNALAGVVNIITAENVNVPLTANGSAYLESVGIYNLNASASVSRGKSIFGLSGGRNFSDGFSLNESSRAMFWKPRRQYTADGYYVYKNSGYKIKLSSKYFDQKILDQGAVIEPHFARDTWFETKRFTQSGEFKTRVGDKRYLNVLAAYSIYDRKRNTFFKNLHTLTEVPATNEGDQDTTRFNALVFRSELSKSTEESNFNYQLGIDVNVESGDGVKLDGRKEIGDYAAYFSIRYNPFASLTLQPGIRYIFNTRYEAPMIYSMNAKWDFHEHHSIRASYARGFRAPSLKELYLFFVDVNHNVRGNPNLSAEDSHHGNLVLSFMKEKGKATYGYTLDLFYNQIFNSIQLIRVGGSNELFSYANIREYNSMGGQLELFYNLYPHFEWKIGISETGRRSLIDEKVSAYDKTLFSTDVNTSFAYRFNKIKSRLSVFYKYTGRVQELYEIDSEVLTGEIGEFHTMDVTFSKRLLSDKLQATAGVKNVFDVTTVYSSLGASGGSVHGGGGTSSNIGYGRSFFIKLAYKFQKY